MKKLFFRNTYPLSPDWEYFALLIPSPLGGRGLG